MTVLTRIPAFFFALILSSLSATVSFGTPPCPDAAWRLENPLPAANNLDAVWGSSANDIYVIGGGVILHHDGYKWSTVYDELFYLEGVWGSSSTDVFAVGTDYQDIFTMESVVLHYDGVAWTRMPVTIPIRLRGVWGSSGSDVFAVGGSGTILHYDGTSWITMASGTGAHLSDIWGTSSSDVFAVGDEGTIYHYDGTAWSGMDAGTLRYVDSVWGSSSTDVYGGAEGGTLVHYNGSTWSELSVEVGPYYKAFIWGSSANDIFVVGREGGIWHYDGVTWSQSPSGTSEFILGVWGTTGENVFAVGSSGTILHYDGSAWSHVSSPFTESLSSVWASSKTDVFAVGYGGIHHYDGSTWSPVATGLPTEPILYSIWGSSGNDIFTAGETGGILHYDGSTWSQMTAGASEPIYGVGGSSADDVFAVGFMGLLYHYDGATWSPMTSGTTRHLRDVWASSPTDAFAVGGVVLHYDGAAWTQMDLPAGSGVWGTSPTNVYATYGGWVMHYDGMSWTEDSSWFGQNLTGVSGISECDVFAVGKGGAIVHYNGSVTVPLLIPRFEASARENAIELSWEITGDETISGFRIYRRDDRIPIDRRLGDGALIAPSARLYTDKSVQPGMRYRYTLGVVDVSGNEVRSRTIEIEHSAHPVTLLQNHPNPFNPATRIRFSIPTKTRVTLQVFNVEGKLITTLIDSETDPGLWEIEWDGRDGAGHPMGSGVYFYRLEAGGQSLSRKMILLK